MTSVEKSQVWRFIAKNSTPFTFFQQKYIDIVINDIPSLINFTNQIKEKREVRYFAISLFFSFQYKNLRKFYHNQKEYISKAQRESKRNNRLKREREDEVRKEDEEFIERIIFNR